MNQIESIRILREKTHLGLSACKKALEQSNWDEQKAIDLLVKTNQLKARDISDREMKNGRITNYIHPGNKLVVMVEINCETDFAADSELFKNFCDVVAMQIAGYKPIYLDRDSSKEEARAKAEEFIKEVIDKPEKVREKIVEGKLTAWYSEVCLMDQYSGTNPKKTIEDLRVELVGQLGENVSVRRFVRWEVGSK